MKEVEIIRNKNIQHRLTVTPTRVTIKLKAGCSEDEEQEVIKFLTTVSNDEKLKNCTISFRGKCTRHLQKGYLCIRLLNDSKSQCHHYRDFDS